MRRVEIGKNSRRAALLIADPVSAGHPMKDGMEMSWRRAMSAAFLLALLSGLAAGCSEDSSPSVNRPPRAPSNPRPADASDTASVDVTLQWDCSDPDGDAIDYEVRFGAETPPPLVASGHTQKTYEPGPLDFHTTYHWMIVATDRQGDQAAGAEWTFKTVANGPPLSPSNPVPADQAVDVPLTTTLRWTATDPEGDPLTFDVFLDTADPPATQVASDITTPSFDPVLERRMTYYWQVVAKDDHGNQTQGDVWRFAAVAYVAFRFAIRHDPTGTEDFVAVTSDSAVIAIARAQLLLPPEDRTLHIHGPIERGDGDHNLSWGWHFTPDEWSLVQFSMELCDGNPSAVEADIDYWVDVIGVFCPWNSYVEEEIP